MKTEHRPAALPAAPATAQASARPVPAAAKPKLPDGLRWSNAWKVDGQFVEGEIEVPVDRDWRIAARLWACPTLGCTVTAWAFGSDPEAPPDVQCCTRHPAQLVPAPLDGSDPNPVTGARARLAAKLRAVYDARRQKVVDAARAQATAAQAEATRVAKRAAADLLGHRPSFVISAVELAVAATVAAVADPLLSATIGVTLATAGTVVAYIAAYLVERDRAQTAGDEMIGKTARKARRNARRVAAGVLATGGWLTLATGTGVDPTTIPGGLAIALGIVVVVWAVNRSHWDTLWADRRRLRAEAQRKATEAARRAEQAAAEAAKPVIPAVVVDESPEAMGRWMAAEWARIARSATVPPGFPMARTWIVPDETREVTAPIDGTVTRVGYEFAIACEPGALVARMGMTIPPLVAAREWLAAMLERRDSSTVSLVDRPDGQVNRGLLLLTEGAALGEVVPWKGRAGIRRGPDGTIYAHVGRTAKGDDVEKRIYIPGQAFGGLRVGHTGGGKTVSTRTTLLNDLAAGIFSTLYDPGKDLMDYAEFVGVIPCGVTAEHRDVIARSTWAEMKRRQMHIGTMKVKDRYNRPAPADAVWDIGRDGPPIRTVWEEFHMEAASAAFLAALTSMNRLQRATAIGIEVVTQGGGLADLNNSMLRGLLQKTCLELCRMPDQLARLAGWDGTGYAPSDLPGLPGMQLMIVAGEPAVQMRGVFVPRGDVDDSVFDQLYAPDMTPLLTAPTLPAQTLEVFEREGLMDLWRLGQGPDGLSRLLAGPPEAYAPPSVTGGTSAPVTNGTALTVADVILAITYTAPGCNSSLVLAHPAWLRVPAEPKRTWKRDYPDLSAISRAAKKLQTDGLLTRDWAGGNWQNWRVTEAGREHATAVAAALLLAGGPGAPTPAEVEGRQLALDEVAAGG